MTPRARRCWPPTTQMKDRNLTSFWFSGCYPAFDDIHSLARPSAVTWHRAVADGLENRVCVLADISVRREIESELHRFAVTFTKERLDVFVELDLVVGSGKDGSGLARFTSRGERRRATSRRACRRIPSPMGHRHLQRWTRRRLRILDGQSRAPFDVGLKSGAKLGVVREARLARRLKQQRRRRP